MAKLNQNQKMYLLRQVMVALCAHVKALNSKFKHVQFEAHEDGWHMEDVLKHLVKTGTFKGVGHHRRSDIISARERYVEGEPSLEERARQTPAYLKLRKKVIDVERRRRELSNQEVELDKQMRQYISDYVNKQNGREFEKAGKLLDSTKDYMEAVSAKLLFEESGDPAELVKKLTADISKSIKL